MYLKLSTMKYTYLLQCKCTLHVNIIVAQIEKMFIGKLTGNERELYYWKNIARLLI